MITQSENAISFIKDVDKITSSLTRVPRWLSEKRARELSRIKQLGWPTIKDEEWKYTNVAPILKGTFQSPSPAKLNETDDFKRYCHGDDIRIVFLNGVFDKHLSQLTRLSTGVTVTNLTEAFVKHDKLIEQVLGKFDIKGESGYHIF